MNLIAFQPTFALENIRIPHFVHNYNCYYPPFRMTERSIECALMDYWLNMQPREEVMEVGAVSPYYWPYRVRHIVDPTDSHPLVTDKSSLFDVSLRNKRVLCVSTLEHVGKGDYGLKEEPEALKRALRKFFEECSDFLITFPGGYNPVVDRWVLSPDPTLPDDVYGTSWIRAPEGNEWSQVRLNQLKEQQLNYGTAWANCLVMLTRGNLANKIRLTPA